MNIPTARERTTLDAVRGLAALAVMIAHVRASTWMEFGALPPEQQNLATAAFFAVTRLGHEAVLVFFVLSGALVGGQIISRLQLRHFSAREYAIDRATRILLPLIPACILTAVISWCYLDEPLGLGTLFANMIGLGGVSYPVLHNDPPLWSLSYEIWFYIFGGATACLIARSGKLAALVLVIMSIGAFTTLNPSYLLYWCLGALATLCLDVRHKRVMFVVGITISIFGIFLYQTSIASKSVVILNYAKPELGELVIVAGLCLLLPLLWSDEMNERFRPIAKPTIALSACSYTLYLVHYPVLIVLEHIFPQAKAITVPSIELFVLRIAVCGVVTVLFYFAFERNTSALRRRLKGSMARKFDPLLPSPAATNPNALPDRTFPR